MTSGNKHIDIIQKPDFDHKGAFCMTSTGEMVEIDLALLEVIGLMWDLGITTNFSCEGYHSDGSDMTTWEMQEWRAYIQMKRDHNSLRLIRELLNTSFFTAEKVSWLIDFDRNPYTQENRILIRFPKQDIPAFEDFLRDQKKPSFLSNISFGKKARS